MEGTKPTGESTGNSARVLIPVDFSLKNSLALNVGFELARRLDSEVTLIHASVIPVPQMVEPQFPDDFNGMDNESEEIEEMQLESEINRIDADAMGKLKRRLTLMQKNGKLPRIKFDTVLAPGTPEEVITEYCETTPPRVIVMATRGKEKRHEELVGSVTAEVIDQSVAPVFTVPEHYSFVGFKEIVRICAFCYFDEGDFSCISRLMDMFHNPEVKIYLYPATGKLKNAVRLGALTRLKESLEKEFPASQFFVGDIEPGKSLREGVADLISRESIQMFLAPNRKRNAISRFFSPGLPHKILYSIDFPMLAIPV